MNSKHLKLIRTVLMAATLAGISPATWAQTPNIQKTSEALLGFIGLNTIPNARMDRNGTIKAGTSHLDPYLHSYLGMQLADPLYIQVRQSAEISSITDEADRLYPGLDLKLRLLDETALRPAIAIGLQSATGHKRMAGEYIALSKRYRDFDLTAGLGWGRFGTAKHLDNPLKGLHKHFDKRRTLDGENPNTTTNWFTGEDIGIFAGLEYFTPWDSLSIKADYGADRYAIEKEASNDQMPKPWSLGLSYKPTNWIHIGAGVQGNDKIFGQLTLKTPVRDIKTKNKDVKEKSKFRSYRTNLALNNQINTSAKKDGVFLDRTHFEGFHTVKTDLTINRTYSLPYQIGQTAKHMSNHAGPAVEHLIIQPTYSGLHGTAIHLTRTDLEKTLGYKQGSAEEIWQSTDFQDPPAALYPKPKSTSHPVPEDEHFSFIIEQQASLSEEDSGLLSRTSAILGYKGPRLLGIIDNAYAIRLNLHDNLDDIAEYRQPSSKNVRSDVGYFSDRKVALENAYTSFTHSFKSDLHLSLLGGYLEEMYAGFGGELLYRPFKSRFALGLEGWKAYKRAPETAWNAGLTGDRALTGHLKAWYDIPSHDLTLRTEIGRYLAEDFGATLALEKHFENGIKLEAFMTQTNDSDTDLFGDKTHAYQGIRMNIPLIDFRLLPSDTTIKTEIEPFGRDSGQRLRNPIPLYDLTDSFSYTHIARHWQEITKNQ